MMCPSRTRLLKMCTSCLLYKRKCYITTTHMLTLLSTVLLFTICITSRSVTAAPSLLSHSHMGISVYSFLWDTTDSHSPAYELRVYMRATCLNSTTKVRLTGFTGIFPIQEFGPSYLSPTSPHFRPPALQRLHLTVSNYAANRTAYLPWYGPTKHGFWRFDGVVEPLGGEILALQGSIYTHQLVIACDGAWTGNPRVAQLQPVPSTGLWNVITTASNNKINPETLAYLLQLHMQYHERLGYNGTILRCNKGEAQAVSTIPVVESLVASNKLIIWPWEHEHSTADHASFFWQKPRNQLTLLAAHGSQVKLSFFDLDEYLVLPQGGNIHGIRCMGRQLLDLAPAMSFARHSARSCRGRVEKDCWQNDQALPLNSGLDIVVERCPCQFHKPLVLADEVVTLSVHFVWARTKTMDVPRDCGFLLHFHALVNEREHFMPPRLPDYKIGGTWMLPKAQGSGMLLDKNGHNLIEGLYNSTYCNGLRDKQQPGQSIVSKC